MFTSINGNEYKYDLSAPKFRAAFDFLKRKDLAELSPGPVDLGYGVTANIQHYNTSPAEELSFEKHRKFFDIQYMTEGAEYIGVVYGDLKVKTPYDSGSDVEFYEDPEFSGSVLLHKDEFVILAPEDAHKPRICAGKPAAVKKIVIKVPV